MHATCIAAGGAGVLLRGPSGAGKSDLALRCLMQPGVAGGGAPIRLVADDQVLLHRDADRLIARAPPTIKGRIEVRGLGIIAMPAIDEAQVLLVADLVEGPVERMPPQDLSIALMGLNIPMLTIRAFEASAPIKLLLALDSMTLPPGHAR